ncbi:MAG: outer membrane beta-barrel protein [Vicinamibacteraceae bacterium]
MSFERIGWVPAAMLVAWVAAAGEAQGQARRPVAIEGTVGWAGFVDDATKHHSLFGVGARWPIGRRISVGPEVFLTHASTDDDSFVLGSVWVDLGPSPDVARVVPYVVMGAGYMRHSERFGRQRFVSGEGSFTAGGGVRAHLTDRIYVGGDLRIGWELHLRAAGHIGVTFPRR